jgi:hypothetical protein
MGIGVENWKVFRDGTKAVVVDSASGTVVTTLPSTGSPKHDGTVLRIAVCEKFVKQAQETKAKPATETESNVPAATSHFVEYKEGMPLGQVYVKPAPPPDYDLEEYANHAANALGQIAGVAHVQGNKELAHDLFNISGALRGYSGSREWLKAFLAKVRP